MTKDQFRAHIIKQLDEYLAGVGPVEESELKDEEGNISVETWLDEFTTHLYAQ